MAVSEPSIDGSGVRRGLAVLAISALVGPLGFKALQLFMEAQSTHGEDAFATFQKLNTALWGVGDALAVAGMLLVVLGLPRGTPGKAALGTSLFVACARLSLLAASYLSVSHGGVSLARSWMFTAQYALSNVLAFAFVASLGVGLVRVSRAAEQRLGWALPVAVMVIDVVTSLAFTWRAETSDPSPSIALRAIFEITAFLPGLSLAALVLLARSGLRLTVALGGQSEHWAPVVAGIRTLRSVVTCRLVLAVVIGGGARFALVAEAYDLAMLATVVATIASLGIAVVFFSAMSRLARVGSAAGSAHLAMILTALSIPFDAYVAWCTYQVLDAASHPMNASISKVYALIEPLPFLVLLTGAIGVAASALVFSTLGHLAVARGDAGAKRAARTGAGMIVGAGIPAVFAQSSVSGARPWMPIEVVGALGLFAIGLGIFALGRFYEATKRLAA